MTDTSVFSQKITQNYNILWFFVCWSFMADDLVDHFFEFVRDLGLEFNLLLALGINGHSVNKSLESKHAGELQKRKSHTSWFLVHVLFI